MKQTVWYRSDVTRYFLDTEFIDDGTNLELVSIAVVSDDGREYEAVNAEARLDLAGDWVKSHVLPHLDPKKQRSRAQIREDLLAFFPRASKAEAWSYYCVAPETKVLTADLKWVPIGYLRAGDTLTAFDEDAPPGRGRSRKWRQWREAVVESTETIERPCYDLTFDDGTAVRCTKDHRWLTSNCEGAKWKTAEQLHCGTSHVVKPLDVWTTNLSRTGGYLAAAFDGEGHITQRDLSEEVRGTYTFYLGFAQKENSMLRVVQQMLHDSGYPFVMGGNKKTGVCHIKIGNRRDVFRFLGSVRPVRLLDKFEPSKAGSMILRTVRLVSKVDAGLRDVVSIKTSTGTYVAEGLASHNCSYDWVLFCQLFGPMVDLPNHLPKHCMCLKQLAVMLGNPRLPRSTGTAHSVLDDARWHRDLFLFLSSWRNT